MTKKSILTLISIVLTIAILFGLCSCNRSFKYDWKKVDAFMEEHGVDYPIDITNGSTFMEDGKTLVITDNKDDDQRTIVQLFRLDKNRRYEYYLEFSIEYYSLIEDMTVLVASSWHLPYYKDDKYDRSYAKGTIWSYNKDLVHEDYFTYLNEVSVYMSKLKIDSEGQFVSCNYDYDKVYYYPVKDYLAEPVLDKPYEYYLDNLFTVGLNETTEYFNKNDLPLFYEFADILSDWIIIHPEK